MTGEFSNLDEDQVFDNDKDPMEAIAELRRAEAEESSSQDDTDIIEDELTPDVDEDTETEVGELQEEQTNEDESDTSDDKENADENTVADEVAKRKFKAAGQEFEFTEQEMLDQFEGVFGKAMDYTQKTQAIAPFRKMISALEEGNITQDQFDLALDLLKGDKSAIKKIADERNIDLNDLSFDEELEPYQTKGHGKSDFDIRISEIEKSIGSDPEYNTTVNVVDQQWDDRSRAAIVDNPDIILLLHSDIKSGVYGKVAPQAALLQMNDGSSKTSLEYYMIAGAQYHNDLKSGKNQEKVDQLNSDTQRAVENFSKESSKAEEKRAASPTGSASGKKGVIDYLDDDDDEKYDEWYKKITSSN